MRDAAIAHDAKLAAIARGAGCTAAQLALVWLIAQGAIAVPKATDVAHVRANRKAVAVRVDDAMRAAIDAAYPPPSRKRPLAIL
jgi:diketogulonate reductase-like aldo/keto reductase